jgi:hypothetical protein
MVTRVSAATDTDSTMKANLDNVPENASRDRRSSEE